METTPFQAEIRPADPRFGDFQANGVLGFAKRNKTNPRALAEQILNFLQEVDPELWAAWEVSLAGPGFINFTAKPAFRLSWLQGWSARGMAEVASPFHGKKVVVDYSSPNSAKQMHVGHLRSMVIGESLARVIQHLGGEVVRDNHLGDWGTQFGILLLGLQSEGGFPEDQDPLEFLENLYRSYSAKTKEDPAMADKARACLVGLQKGDPASLEAWEKINRLSLESFDKIYRKFDVRFDLTLGESFYRDQVEQVYRELQSCGLAVEDQGALVVFHPEHPRFSKVPFIVRKSDGASNYATTDLATVLYRVQELGASSMVYVTDVRQRDHFEQLFLTVQKWFKATDRPIPDLHHVWFGTILGDDGKAIKTRSGEPIRLASLVREAEQRCRNLLQERDSSLSEEQLQETASAIGVAAIRYADLMQNRVSDYTFSWDKLISTDGNTAPYLMYAAARIQSIFRQEGAQSSVSPTPPETSSELALTRQLMLFPEVLGMTGRELKPHHLCTWLFELSSDFSRFYAENRVLVEDEGVKARRLLLCQRTLEMMRLGMDLLGLPVLEKM